MAFVQGVARCAVPTIRAMLEALNALVAPALMERLTLVANHVLAGEPVAAERLRPHHGRSIRLHFDGWPSLLPAPPSFAFRVTPAGLLEWRGADPPDNADLQVRVDASNPALLMADLAAGVAPAVELRGDAAFATDINWLIANLRWDAEADLERFFGARVAHQIARIGAALARGMRGALRSASELATMIRPKPRS
jgi:ubiquinone biosynthesis protein UbiJ